MNVNSQTNNSNRQPKIFNHPGRFVEGWYWAIPSDSLKIGEVKAVTLLGRELVIYRAKDRKLVTVDAYCPHMGAHLAEGRVEGNGLRCFFHKWKFDADGFCVDIPCLDEPLTMKLNTWPTAEKYGLIWVWTGEFALQPLPFIPNLEQQEYDYTLVSHFLVNCHPHVVMINPIDVQHFHAVDQVPLEFAFEKEELNQNAIIFSNNTRANEGLFLIKLMRQFYKKPVKYSVCYWYGTTGTVTIGPDFLNLHIMLTLRLLEGGKTEGQILLIMKKRKGIFGWLYNRILLQLAKIAGTYFLESDIKIVSTIKFDLKTPLKTDQAIMQFINHLERQTALCWGTWQLPRSRDAEIKDNRIDKWQDALND